MVPKKTVWVWGVCQKASDLTNFPISLGISFGTLAKSFNLLNTSSRWGAHYPSFAWVTHYFKILSVPETDCI